MMQVSPCILLSFAFFTWLYALKPSGLSQKGTGLPQTLTQQRGPLQSPVPQMHPCPRESPLLLVIVNFCHLGPSCTLLHIGHLSNL